MANVISILAVIILLLIIIIPIYAFFKYTGISIKATFTEIRSNFKPDLRNTLRDYFFGFILPILLLPIIAVLIVIVGIIIIIYLLFFAYKPFKSLKYTIFPEMKDLKYFFNKNFLLKFSNNFIWKTKNFVIILKKEYHKRNLYCYDNNNLLCVIREVDNILNNYDFLKAVYSNYYASEVFDYNKFIEYSNQMGMYIRTYNINNKLPKDEKFNIEKLLKINDINLEFKKININTANLQEIINLPFINIVAAKKIQNHIKESGNFKTFWEFAKFLNLNINQGLTLSKLVFVKPIKNSISKQKTIKINKINKKEKGPERGIDL